MIDREIEHARAGRPARIIAKMNSLEERKVCRPLYGASQAGVQIDLIVRGFCSLRPGVPGLSENIRVISRHRPVPRALAGSSTSATAPPDPIDGEFYIGSADWMYRNLLGRVEAVVPIENPPLRERLWDILQLMLTDQRQAWDLHPDGTYIQRTPADPAKETGVHQTLMALARQQSALAAIELAGAILAETDLSRAASSAGSRALVVIPNELRSPGLSLSKPEGVSGRGHA